MNVSTLVIFVSDYPYGPGEPFLEEELKVISKKFDKIYLINFIEEERKLQNVPFEFYVPENADVLFIKKGKKYANLKWLFSFTPMYEIFLAIFKHKKKFSISLFKLIYSYWIEGVRNEGVINKIILDEKINIDSTVFYSYWCDTNCISLSNISKKNKLQFVTRLHGWDLYFERHNLKFLPFREKIFNEAFKVLPISNDGRKYILDNKFTISKNKVIESHLGVRDLSVNPRYLKIENSDKTLKIITISHINQVKSMDRLVDALVLIDNISIQWVHIGYGFEKFETEFLKRTKLLFNEKQNISFDFRGKLPKEEVFEALEKEEFDLIINCSKAEGIPVSLMEAFSASIPAIAFNVGGIPEILKNDFNGFLLEHEHGNHVKLLKEAIEHFSKLSFEEKKVFSDNSKTIWRNSFNSAVNFSKISDVLHYRFEDGKSPKVSCEKCLVDSDIHPEIVLDKYGVCDICSIVSNKNQLIENQRDDGYLDKLLTEIKNNKGNNKYDCLLGISGGVDSAYLALKVKEWGLNPLLVHIDTGWNSELAVDNIKSLIDQLGFELYTVVIDWNEIQDVVRAFMRASVIDIDWANELSAQASLNEVAAKFKIKHILTGHQVATEGWMPSNIVHFKLDLINFKAIHKRFGERKLKTYPTIGFAKTYYYENIAKIKFYNPLDYIPYVKDDVKKILSEQYGWRDYGHKHYENIFTRFYQGYILPTKFKVDKRIFHYSAMIVSGQLTKEKAIELIKNNPYDDLQQLESDKEFVIKKLGFSHNEFEQILAAKPKSHLDYPSIINIINKLRKIKNVIQNNR